MDRECLGWEWGQGLVHGAPRNLLCRGEAPQLDRGVAAQLSEFVTVVVVYT